MTIKREGADLDDVMDALGERGKYQAYFYSLIAFVVLICGVNLGTFIFVADIPKYRCFIPECEDLANTSYNEPMIAWAIPQRNTLKVMGVKTGNCERYMSKNLTNLDGNCSKAMFSDEIQRCNEWVFDDQHRTAVTDFKLTCSENQHKVRFVITSYMAGKVVGSILIGFLADRYGRKSAFVTCTVLMGVFGFLQGLSLNYEMLVSLIFIQAVVGAPVHPIAIVLVVEMFGKKKRGTAGIGLHYFQTIGNALVSPVVWYSGNWITTQLVISIPAILLFFYYWLLPESVRWLLTKKKNLEALAILQKISEVNKVDLSIVLSESSPLTVSNIVEQPESFLTVMKNFFQSKKLLYRAIIVFIIWGFYFLIYFSLTINSITLVGNKYLNYVLVFTVGIPGIAIATVCVNKFGSKRSLVSIFLLCGIIYFIIIFVSNSSHDWIIITVYLIGKFGMTCVGAVAHIYTAEIFPTNLRSAGLAIAYSVGRLAGLASAYISSLSLYYKHLPMILLGILSISSGLLSLILPETEKIPDTVEEADNV